MIETRTSFDKDSNDLIIEYKNNLLIDYSDILTRLLAEERDSVLPSSSRIDRLAPNKINLIINLSGKVKQVSDNRLQIPTDIAESVNRIFNKFANEALTKKNKSYEIIPLQNYDIVNIQKDIKAMVKNNRDLCVITDYKDYLRSRNEPADKTSFTQATYKYLSDDYNNIVVAALNGDMTEVTALVKDKLKKTDWM